MKFVITQKLCNEGMELLKDVREQYIANDPDPRNYMDQMRDADALIMRLAVCGRAVIEGSPDLKVIGRTGIGYDTIDIEAATERGIPVVVTPGANNRSVAEHAVAMIFALSKNIVETHSGMCAGNWEIRNSGKGFELEGKTAGIIGLGPIGRETVKICLGIGLNVMAYDPFFTREQIEALGVEYCSRLDGLLQSADIVSVHMPLVDATRDLIARRELSMMKKTAILINCSRGGIVNEADLVSALKAGEIAGAGLDVFCSEPPEVSDPLLTCPNLILSPHTAAQTREAVVKMAEMCVNGCLAVCHGKKWPYVVDKSVYDHPRWAGCSWAEV